MKNVIVWLWLFVGVDFVANPLRTGAAPSAPGAANPKDAICYVELQDGQVIDLSRICGGSKGRVALSSLDQQFLNAYQSTLKNRYGRSPSSNPQALVERAKGVCTSVRNGLSPSLTAFSQPGLDATVMGDLALGHYCPELDD